MITIVTTWFTMDTIMVVTKRNQGRLVVGNGKRTAVDPFFQPDLILENSNHFPDSNQFVQFKVLQSLTMYMDAVASPLKCSSVRMSNGFYLTSIRKHFLSEKTADIPCKSEQVSDSQCLCMVAVMSPWRKQGKQRHQDGSELK